MSDLVIASTTDSEAQIRAAMGRGVDAPTDEPVLAEVDAKTGEPIEEPEATKPAEKQETAEKDAKKAEKAFEKADKEAAAKPDGEEKPATRADKRISQLTAEKYTQMRRADQLQTQLEDMQRRVDALLKASGTAETKPEAANQQEKPAEAAEAPEPTPDKFKTYEDYVKALGQWSAQITVKAAIEAERERTAQATVQEEAAVARTHFEDARAAAAQRYPDFEETMQGDVAQALPLTDAMQHVILTNALGHDMAYHLVKHPDEAEMIAKLDGPDQIFAMGALAERVKSVAAKAQKAVAGGEKEKPEKPPVSAAPPPIEPVGAHATTSTVPDDQLAWREWADKRNREETAKRKRR